ncbi:thioesterase [Actinoplanes cyaneus]|uniref:Thioesterase n=1 Tax=Actinoplanes cyaneus TaxID=52696 RepID=A0A919ITV5_9ACTN|nr:acyl-CoA thioesterase [Actinoplanes cyaneus]MCW2144535.1 acyl-CoA thioester hydrolase [Actinoplanes cyaneus]GID71187.1 thioesterase [Actinoplanes cyaneus]
MNNAAITINYGDLQPVEIHFDDLDIFGVVHSSRYTMMLERGLSAYWARRGHDISLADSDSDAWQMVREVRTMFERPIRRIAPIYLHLWTEHRGRTSMTTGFRFISADGTEQYAHGRRIVIRFNPVTRRPSEWSARARADADALLRPAHL